MLYGYGCGGDGENPLPDTINDVDNPCIRSMVSSAINSGLKNKITQFINDVFSNSEDFHLKFTDGIMSIPSRDAETVPQPMSGGGIMYVVKLNEIILSNASQEYITATIFHEVLHAWVYYTYPTTSQTQHSIMASSTNINKLALALQEMFPTLDNQAAIDLAWGGLSSTIPWSALTTTEQNRIMQVNENYKDHTLGTPCP